MAVYCRRGAERLDEMLADGGMLERMGRASRERFGALFTWDDVLAQYEGLLERKGLPGDALLRKRNSSDEG